MHTMTGRYEGVLRTEARHLKSGNAVVTDAPPDNNGKGEAFSPTDLLCASLSSCMMTLMGITADREQVDLSGLTSKITKVMLSDPRRVGEVHIAFHHPALKATELQKEKLKRAAITCPVAKSLNPEIKQVVTFDW
jgi:uncharacterized OsmC-like protein